MPSRTAAAFASTGGNSGTGTVSLDPVKTPWVQFPHVQFGLYPIPASLQLPTTGTVDSTLRRADDGNGYNVWARVYPDKPTTAQMSATLKSVNAALAHDGWTITDTYVNSGVTQYTISGSDKGKSYEGYLIVYTQADFWQTAWQLTLYPTGSFPWAPWPRPAALAKPSAWNLEFVALVNKARAVHGLHALTWCPAIAMSEQAQVQDEITRGYPEIVFGMPVAYAFQELAGDFGNRATLFGYGGVSGGLAWLPGDNVADVAASTAAASGSPSSGQFLYSPYATVVGVGVATGAGGGRDWRVTFGDTTDGC